MAQQIEKVTAERAVIERTATRTAAFVSTRLPVPMTRHDHSSMPEKPSCAPPPPKQHRSESLPTIDLALHSASRGPDCVVVGAPFVFEMANTGPPVRVAWFACTDTTASLRSAELACAPRRTSTLLPLNHFTCPTTDAGSRSEPRALRFECQTGGLAVHRAFADVGRPRSLQLFLTDPLEQGYAPDGLPPRPLLIVPLLWPLGEVQGVPPPSPTRGNAGPAPRALGDDAARGRIAELLTAGRSVGVYGLGCKRALLEAVGDASELRHFAVHLLDPWALGAAPAALGNGAPQPAAVQRACGHALDCILGNLLRYDRQHIEGGSAMEEDRGGNGFPERQLEPARAAPPRSRSTSPVKVVVTSSATHGTAAAPGAFPVRRSTSPSSHSSTPVRLVRAETPDSVTSATLGGSSANPRNAGSGTSLYDLTEGRRPITAVFGASCRDDPVARRVVYDAVGGGGSRTRPRRMAPLVGAGLSYIADRRLRHLIVVHSIDCLDDATTARLAQLCTFSGARVVILCSFDTPSYPTRCCAPEALGLALRRVDTLLPYTRDLFASRSHQAAFEAFESEALRGSAASVAEAESATRTRGVGRSRRGGTANGSGGLPLRDTVVRSLLSVPERFRVTLRLILRRQEELGVDVFLGVNPLMDHLASAHGIMLPTARFQAIRRELESNRIVEYDPSTHAIRVLQLPLVMDVLSEVEAGKASS